MVDNDDPIMVRQIINAAGYDTETGIYGVGYSPDNGKTFYVQNTSAGRKFRQQDADGLWPLLIDKVKSVMSIDWDSIQNKPKFVTPDELETRLDKLSVPTVKWADIEDKPPIPSIDGLVKETELADYAKKSEMPNVDGLAKQSDLDDVKATTDSAISKAEQAQSTADANTKALQNVYTKEESDRKYWTAEQEQNASNVKSVNNIDPDDQGNVNIDLTGYAKTSDIPKTMDWSQIIGKPNLALTSDIPSLDDYAKLTDIPSVTGLVKETELADYVRKSDLPTMPDLSGYATVSSLIDYAKKSDLPDFSKYALKNELPITMAWQNITGKPDLATQDDLKNIELKPGPQGEPGTPGKDGVTPHIDSTTGDWFIGNQDTGTQAQGPAGENGRDGADGQPGKDGQNGITPHIDTATGNWFVGSTDTGIKAQGPQGIQGVPGKDGRNGINGKDGTDVDLSGYATTEAVQKAQSTADNAYKIGRNDDDLIKQLSNRVDAIKIPDLSGYAKTSQIPTDVVTHAELTTTKWLDTGTTWLNGNGGSIQYRAITIGNYHIVEVTGSMNITTKAYAITSAFKIPLLGFEDSTTMHFSGGSTITNEIPVAFMAGDPGEVKLYTWQNVNNGWTEVHLSWTYVGGD